MQTASVHSPDTGLAIEGKVHGGQQPIVGAQVYLFAANTTGYGNASVSLLTSVPGSTTLDTSGGATNGDYFVTTGAGGSFSITGDYSCTAGSQVYLYALGGNPGLGSGANPSSGLMAALGTCPSADNFLSTIPFVSVNEVSTIAAAYAFAGFATDATHVSSSGTALAQVGIANAFANAANLAGISTGAALTTTPAGNGVVPQATIDTLADILSACVNSAGAVTGPANPSACYTLFNNADSGGSTGTVPADTATAAINIAHNPGLNIAALYGLVGSSPPFAPTLSAAPNDFTIGLNFTGGGLSQPQGIAIDGSGNAWVQNAGITYSVSEFSNAGAALSGANGFTGGGQLEHPRAIAIDKSGNAWISNVVGPITGVATGGSVVVLNSSGSAVAGSPYSLGSLIPDGIAIDGSGNAWLPSGNSVTELSGSGAILSGANGFTDGAVLTAIGPTAIDGSGNVWIPDIGTHLTEFSNSGSVLSAPFGYSGGGLQNPDAIAIDNSGSAWLLNNGNPGSHIISKFSSSGSSLFGSNGLVGLGLSNTSSIAIDGSGSAWIANFGSSSANYADSSINEFSNSGAMLFPGFGYFAAGTLTGPDGIAIDGSGDVWVTNYVNKSVTEVIGVATPVVTPLAAGVANNSLGARP